MSFFHRQIHKLEIDHRAVCVSHSDISDSIISGLPFFNYRRNLFGEKKNQLFSVSKADAYAQGLLLLNWLRYL